MKDTDQPAGDSPRAIPPLGSASGAAGAPLPNAEKMTKPLAPRATAASGMLGPAAKGTNFDASVPPLRELRASDLRSPRRRRVLQPLLLFVLTCCSTFWAGATHWMPFQYFDSPGEAWRVIVQNGSTGLTYMLAVMGILLMHEMGHFVQTLRYRVPASLPLFLPLPISPLGTMGAVILMDTSKADRKELFDIGLSGPWAGLLAAIPLIWYGIATAVADPQSGDAFPFGMPLIFQGLMSWLRPDLTGTAIVKNPFFMAGWVGMLVTGLNMLPVSQLDGGHVIYGMFGKQAKWVARAFISAAILFVVVAEQYNWILMLVLVILLGVDHPPTRDDRRPLGKVRFAIGLVSLLIPVFCFTPMILPPDM